MMHSLPSPWERAKPNQHPLKAVIVVVIGIGLKGDSSLVLQERKEITRVMDKNLSRIALLKVVSRTRVEVVHHILTLLWVAMG